MICQLSFFDLTFSLYFKYKKLYKKVNEKKWKYGTYFKIKVNKLDYLCDDEFHCSLSRPRTRKKIKNKKNKFHCFIGINVSYVVSSFCITRSSWCFFSILDLTRMAKQINVIKTYFYFIFTLFSKINIPMSLFIDVYV